MPHPELSAETRRRRTFAIISHPDAGKTTLTEKLLLYGGAIRQAGSVKARKAARHATSDWMEIEKQRLPHQYSGHPRSPGLFRGHLPHPRRRRQRRDADRLRQGR